MSVYSKLMNVQGKLKAPKSQKNNSMGYFYRSCEDIMESVKPLLLEQGLILRVSDDIQLIGDRYYIKATATVIDIEDGQEISTTAFARECANRRGMDESQITGSASSYARKYALNGLFCIDDTKDADATNTHGKEAQKPLQSEKKVNELYILANSKNVKREVLIAQVMKKFNKSIAMLTDEEYKAVYDGYSKMQVQEG